MPAMPITNLIQFPHRDRLAEIRHRMGLSQEEMSRLLFATPAEVSRWELGVAECPHRRLTWYAMFDRALEQWSPNADPRGQIGVWLDVEGVFGALYRILGVIYGP